MPASRSIHITLCGNNISNYILLLFCALYSTTEKRKLIMKTTVFLAAVAIAVFISGFLLGQNLGFITAAHAQNNKVFELRTYTTAEGKLPNLLTRFRDHTMTLFEKHDMTNVGYWVPQDSPDSENTLIYLLEHSSRQAAQENWANFLADAEVLRIMAESEAAGSIISSIESVFVEPTSFSPIR